MIITPQQRLKGGVCLTIAAENDVERRQLRQLSEAIDEQHSMDIGRRQAIDEIGTSLYGSAGTGDPNTLDSIVVHLR